MLVKTGVVTNISITTATVSGDILDLGEGVSKHGHCWSTNPNCSVADLTTDLGAGSSTGGFTSLLNGLQPETTYYVKAYCNDGKTTVYGSEINFTTASDARPALTTTPVTSIQKTSASSGGNITYEGGTPVKARGVCWNVGPNPVISDYVTSSGTGAGSFISTMTGLNPGTTYYVRAYATNDGGTAYGNEYSFTTQTDTPVAPTVTTAAVSAVTDNSAMCGGNVTNEGTAAVIAKGVCWNTLPNPTIAHNTTNDGSGGGSFVSAISGLDPGTKYYVRAYATSSVGTSYGGEDNFTTEIIVPALTTLPVSSITSTSASSGGDITSTGGANILAKGVCWSTSINPSTADNITNDGIGSDTYTSSITGLTALNTYHVRAYATNSAGTAYGQDISFTTKGLATVSTTAITSITSSSAVSGGNVTFDGGAPITARGVCWSTASNPTISDFTTTDGTGPGPFTSVINGLASNKVYHVRAYATNSEGTAYGSDRMFSTLCPSSMTLTHTVGTVAPITTTITYGIVKTNLSGEDKCWISQNLGALNQAPTINDTYESSSGWYWQFNTKQGFRHNGNTRTPVTMWISSIDGISDWIAANDPCTLLLGSGWRIPTLTEWSNVIQNGGWSTPEDAYASVLKVHPAGSLASADGSLLNRGFVGNYWTNMQYTSTQGVMINIYIGVSTYSSSKAAAGTLRCIRD